MQYPLQAKPVGVILIALYSYISGSLCVLCSIPWFFISGINVPLWVPILGIAYLGVSVLLFATGYGLWTLRDWARKLAIGLYALSLLVALMFLIYGKEIIGLKTPPAAAFLLLASILISIVVILYLLNDNVRSVFQGGFQSDLALGRAIGQVPNPV